MDEDKSQSENSESEKLTPPGPMSQSHSRPSSASEVDTPVEEPAEDESVNVEELTSLLNKNSIVSVPGPSVPAKSSAGADSEKPIDPKKKNKVTILLKPVGDAPILKQKLFIAEPEKNVAWIIQYIRRYMRLEPEHSLFFFINQAFAPSPDQLLGNLYECFGAGGKLTLHYSTTMAWG